MFWKKNKVVTHNSRFHADDLFAVATLDLVFDGKIEIIRSRDKEIIDKADIVVDVGFEYDPEKNRFDHHQKGGAGIRENGVPYASFGLIWKHFGRRLCSEEAWEIIENKIVQSIDAGDNGISTYEIKKDFNINPYIAQLMFLSFMPSWKEKINLDEAFLESVELVKKVLRREIIHAEHHVEAKKIILEIYEKSPDKRFIVFDEDSNFSDEDIGSVLINKPEVLFSIKYRPENKKWHAKGVKINADDFPIRKYFPKEWAGLPEDELQKISGVNDASFCHNGLFLCAAGSLSGILEMVKKTLEK